MGRPKLLNIFIPTPDEILYTKTPSYVTVVKEDTNLVVQETITEVQEGSSITFKAPCACSTINGVKINGIVYEILETDGTAANDNAFIINAMVTLKLDITNSKAYIQNSVNKNVLFVTVVKNDTNLEVQESVNIENGSFLTFLAPCACSEVTGVKINNTVYEILEASGKAASDEAFTANALVTVVIYVTDSKAYIQNSANNGSSGDSTAGNTFVSAVVVE